MAPGCCLLPVPVGEGWGGGLVRAVSCAAVVLRLGPGFRPGGRVTFFVSPKKVTKERRPHCARPSAALRATCGARSRRGPRKLASLKHARPFFRLKLRSSARAEGIWNGPLLRSATNGLAARGLEQGQGNSLEREHGHGHEHRRMHMRVRVRVRVRGCRRQRGPRAHAHLHSTQGRAMARWTPSPLWPRRGAELFADQGRACLSEASLRGPREKRAPQVARSEAEGRGRWGRLSLVTFFGETKKVTRPPGRIPGPSLKQGATPKQANVRPHLTPRPQGTGEGTTPQ
ncbi:hypothetical protein CHC07_00740 [Variovorax sp. B4]|nr:hypothetical protein CHC07_00740 [Variovorax sp. B4]PNG61194.1 hypothetical protein CHC06_01095 [Variovorax sp. B2]